MGEINLTSQTIVDEIVGIVGMLSDRSGSTRRDIAQVLESLHGPVRQDVVEDGLELGVLTGALECRNRRYKVRKQRNLSRNVSLMDTAGCSSWGTGVPRSTSSNDDLSSVSYMSAQTDFGGETSRHSSETCSVREIMSVKSIQSSDRLSTCSYTSGPKSRGALQGSLSKGGKRKEKKHLVVKLPMLKKKSTVENDTEESSRVLDEGQQITNENVHNELPMINPEDDKGSDEPGASQLSAKRSLNDIMSQVMKEITEEPKNNENVPSHFEDSKNEVVNKGNKSKDTHDGMRTLMYVMKKVNNFELSESGETHNNSLPSNSEDLNNETVNENNEAINEEKKSEGAHDNMTKLMSEVMKKINNSNSGKMHNKNNPSCSEECSKELLVNQESGKKDTHDVSKVMSKVMKKINNCEPSESEKPSDTPSKGREVSESDVKSLDEVLNKVMKRVTGADVQSTAPAVLNNDTNLCTDVISSIKTVDRSVGTAMQDVLPCCSKSGIPKSAKRRKVEKQESDSSTVNCHRYLTRSRTKANELRRSRAQSPSDSATSVKKAKIL